MKKRSAIIFGLLFVLLVSFVAGKSVDVYFFYSETCPHCRAEIQFLNEFNQTCQEFAKDVNIHYLLANENQALLAQLAEEYNTTTFAVPRTFIGDRAYVGFSPEDGNLEFHPVYKAYIGYENIIVEQINALAEENESGKNESCEGKPEQPGVEQNKNSWIFLLILIYGLSYFFLRKKLTESKNGKKYWISGLMLLTIICLFIFFSSQSEVSIKNFAEGLPFPFFVTVIALADGFNPCAFTVLIILLSLLTYTKSKKDMGIIGFTFIITSALMYFLFIMLMVLVGSWAFEKYGSIILLVLGVVITIAGIINLKDFFFFGKGISLTMSDNEKLVITKKARKIVNMLRESTTKKGFLLALLGTILLAIFVNMVELGCTAILPAVYMTSLIRSFGETINIPHIVWTLYYSVVYILPLLVIMLVFMYSFKSTRVTEKQGRILKLVSGLFMLGFGLIMMFWPELLVFG